MGRQPGAGQGRSAGNVCGRPSVQGEWRTVRFVIDLSHNIHLTVKLPLDHARSPQAAPGEGLW